MGYSRMDSSYTAEYVVDTLDDVEDLPTGNSPGSTCLVISTGDVLVLDTEGN